MDRLFRGIIRYRNTERRGMVQQFEQVKNNPVAFMVCLVRPWSAWLRCYGLKRADP
ncbi:unnamed protein product [Nesidiocoris tenuis]|uniref:Uncharacterized protein n=1 Tax=Nesidiocoris tenuis TaxID=355587 RepID=A0A6H5GNH1_9HEMI|nr:unnamed protein product [Nesidiocoris tenuis]